MLPSEVLGFGSKLFKTDFHHIFSKLPRYAACLTSLSFQPWHVSTAEGCSAHRQAPGTPGSPSRREPSLGLRRCTAQKTEELNL
jgi:hypothetical protein